MNHTVRRAGPRDLPAIAALVRAFGAELATIPTSEPV